MKLETLKPTVGSRKTKYRAARGMAQGRGKQAGKGQSGQNKRTGSKPGFEGGQNPLFRRIPKIGFTNINAKTYQVVSLGAIDKKFKDGEIVNFASLTKHQLISRKYDIKILGTGKLNKKLTFQVQAASKSATEAINKTGSKLELISS